MRIERKESKKLKSFQKLLQQIGQSPQDNQSGQGQTSASIRGNVYYENDQELDISVYIGIIPR